MTEFKDAKRIAKNHLGEVTHCVEYTNAYVFTNAHSSTSIGGFDKGVAVLKKTGEAMSEERYFAEYGRASIREIDC